MIRTSFSKNRYAVGDEDLIVGTMKSDLGGQARGIIFCHGSGQSAQPLALEMHYLWDMLGRRAVVHVGDLGGQTWGSDTAVARIKLARAELRRRGVDGPIALVGLSMGSCNALNYAIRYPDEIACLALTIPVTDLVATRADPTFTSVWPEIDAIYGAPPSANYTGHNPIDFVDDLPADMPVKVWYAPNDPIVKVATVNAFLAARPQTESRSMGNVGHNVPRPFYWEINKFVADHLPDRPAVTSPLSIVGEPPVAQLSEPGTAIPVDMTTSLGITLYGVAEGADLTDNGRTMVALVGTAAYTNPSFTLHTSISGSDKNYARLDGTVIGQAILSATGGRLGKRVMCATLSADNLSATFEIGGLAQDTRAITGGFAPFKSLELRSATASTKPIHAAVYAGVHTPAQRKAMLTWLAQEYGAVPPLP